MKAQLLMLGWGFRRSRYKIWHQEVDLVFGHEDGSFLLIEVKAISDLNFVVFNLRRQQFEGYRRILESLRERGVKVDLWLALVMNDDSIQWIKEVF